MKNAKYQNDHGATTDCTLRMAKATVSSNHAHKDTLYGNLWFASVKTAIVLNKELSCHFVGHVKTSH